MAKAEMGGGKRRMNALVNPATILLLRGSRSTQSLDETDPW